ncbi:unnamed protein product, partial [Protopolystoma xenopodis]
ESTNNSNRRLTNFTQASEEFPAQFSRAQIQQVVEPLPPTSSIIAAPISPQTSIKPEVNAGTELVKRPRGRPRSLKQGLSFSNKLAGSESFRHTILSKTDKLENTIYAAEQTVPDDRRNLVLECTVKKLSKQKKGRQNSKYFRQATEEEPNSIGAQDELERDGSVDDNEHKASSEALDDCHKVVLGEEDEGDEVTTETATASTGPADEEIDGTGVCLMTSVGRRQRRLTAKYAQALEERERRERRRTEIAMAHANDRRPNFSDHSFSSGQALVSNGSVLMSSSAGEIGEQAPSDEALSSPPLGVDSSSDVTDQKSTENVKEKRALKKNVSFPDV